MNAWVVAGSLFMYFVVLWVISLLFRPVVLGFLTSHGITAANYEQVMIPSAAGVLVWFSGGAGLILLNVWSLIPEVDGLLVRGYEIYFLALTIVFWLGWTDDLVGDRTVKGWRGHFGQWIKNGVLSTGLLKAVGTAIVSVWFIVVMGLWQGILLGLVSWLVLPLFTNALNMFDLRPGRALKVFLLGSVVIVSASAGRQTEAWAMLMPAIAGACSLLPVDLKGQAMLGDTGANVLGFSLGSVMVMYVDHLWQVVSVLLLLGLNIVGERYSITAVIERVPVLDWFDRLGRNRQD